MEITLPFVFPSSAREEESAGADHKIWRGPVWGQTAVGIRSLVGPGPMDPASSGPMSIVAVNVLPFPSSLRTSMSPPIARAKRRLMVKPRPVPPNSRVTELSAWTNESKIEFSLSAGIPIPVSITSKAIFALPGEAISRHTIRTLPWPVNLIGIADEVDQQLLQPQRVGEDAGRHAVSGTGTSTPVPFSRARTRVRDSTQDRISCSAQGMRLISIAPRFDPGEIEDVVDQFQQVRGTGMNGMEKILSFRRISLIGRPSTIAR